MEQFFFPPSVDRRTVENWNFLFRISSAHVWLSVQVSTLFYVSRIVMYPIIMCIWFDDYNMLNSLWKIYGNQSMTVSISSAYQTTISYAENRPVRDATFSSEISCSKSELWVNQLVFGTGIQCGSFLFARRPFYQLCPRIFIVPKSIRTLVNKWLSAWVLPYAIGWYHWNSIAR